MSKYHGYQHPTEPVTCSQCGREYPPNTAICYACNRYLANEWMGDVGTPDNQIRSPEAPMEDWRQPPPVPPEMTRRDTGRRDPGIRDVHARFRRWRKALVIMAMGYGAYAAFVSYQQYRGNHPIPESVSPSTQSATTAHQTGPTVTLHGTVTAAGQLTAPVLIWQYTGGKWVHEQGTALLDTGGGQQSILNGTALTQAGGRDNPALGTIPQSGIGNGTVTGHFYPHIFIAPLTDPKAYFLANQTLPSGLGQAVDSQEIVNIALGTLDQGHLTVNGQTWTWTYRVR